MTHYCVKMYLYYDRGEDMDGQYLIIGSAVVIALVIVIVILHFIRQFEMKYYRDKIKELEKQRNIVASTPVLLELSKVEPIIKNDKMEEKYNKWQDEFVFIKENRLTLIDDMLIDLDIYIDKRDYKSCGYSMAKIEMEIYKVREAADHLLEEIKDITLSEEKYRAIVTKLKTKYRELNKDFQDHKNLYEQMQEPISLQLENIERRFLDFEKVMDDNDYAEEVEESETRLAKNKIYQIQHEGHRSVFDRMVRNLSEAALKNEDAKGTLIDESGKLDMDAIVESARCMYALLETVSTIQLEKVDIKYIEDTLKSIK